MSDGGTDDWTYVVKTLSTAIGYKIMHLQILNHGQEQSLYDARRKCRQGGCAQCHQEY
mgnify:CR=1 FL=1